MVAKISVGSSVYGALAYNAEKINKEKGRVLDTNKIYNDGSGNIDIRLAFEDFKLWMPQSTRAEKTMMHISLNPHPDDKLSEAQYTQLAHEYMEKMGFGDMPYLIVKHEDIDRHHLHIVTVNVDENGKRLNRDFLTRPVGNLGGMPDIAGELHGVHVFFGTVRTRKTVSASCQDRECRGCK